MEQTIFVIDDDKDILKTLTGYLTDYKVHTFSNCDDLLKSDLIDEVNLFIIDIKLGSKDGRNLCRDLIKQGYESPCLFISGYINEDVSKMFNMLPDNCLYDFMQKPINMSILKNRIRLLLSCGDKADFLEEASNKAKANVWNLINYSNLYCLIIDKDFIIKVINYPLAIKLGGEHEKDPKILGQNCLKFCPEDQIGLAEHIVKDINDGSELYKEVIMDLKDLNGEITPIKWFNSKANNHEGWLFSIGIPLIRQVDSLQDIDSLRAYYRNVLDKDRTMINVIKDKAAKN